MFFRETRCVFHENVLFSPKTRCAEVEETDDFNWLDASWSHPEAYRAGLRPQRSFGASSALAPFVAMPGAPFVAPCY